jgi:hypothetical protein
MNASQKLLSGLKNVFQKPHKAFQGFTGLTKLHTKIYADMLLHFAIHRSQRETRS